MTRRVAAIGRAAMLLGFALGCSGRERAFRPGAGPDSVPLSRVPSMMRRLPDYAHLAITGVAYYKGRLYATTTLGIFVVNGDSAEILLQWNPRDPVEEGPANDIANDALWLEHAATGTLARLDSAGWHDLPLPPPPNDKYYTRGDMLQGFPGISDSTAFWLVGGGAAWQWDPAKSSWIVQPMPPAPEFSAVQAVAPLGKSLLYVMQVEVTYKPAALHAVYDRGQNWKKYSLPTMELAQVVATLDAVYIRTDDGALYAATPGAVALVKTPGPCEAIARTSTGTLLASFPSDGIYSYEKGRWTSKVRSPYGPSEGKHWAYLAEENGKLAYATTQYPDFTDGPGSNKRTGTDALWVLKGTELRRVKLQ